MNNINIFYVLLFNFATCAAVAIFFYMIGSIFLDYWCKTKKTWAEIIVWICLVMVYFSGAIAFIIIIKMLKSI